MTIIADRAFAFLSAFPAQHDLLRLGQPPSRALSLDIEDVGIRSDSGVDYCSPGTTRRS